MGLLPLANDSPEISVVCLLFIAGAIGSISSAISSISSTINSRISRTISSRIISWHY